MSHDDFKIWFPYFRFLNHIPLGDEVTHYREFFKTIESDVRDETSKHHLIKLLDLSYCLVNTYSNLNMATKILQVLQVFGISTIQKIYEALLKEPKFKISPRGILAEKHLIDELPDRVGAFVYFIFADLSYLFQPKALLSFENGAANFSIIDFMTAYRLDVNILQSLENIPAFLARIATLNKNTDKTNIQRKLIHAIYHQAHPEKCLYLREFIQNAMDAYSAQDMQDAGQKIAITISQDGATDCVLTLEDRGVGMTLEDIFKFLLVPGSSSKRHGIEGQFIGGRGVGLFTAISGAKKLLIKTGKGDGRTQCITLTPIYERLANGEQRVKDITLQFSMSDELFRGTIIQRVSAQIIPALQAAIYHRALSTHAKFIHQAEFCVTLNDTVINQTMTPLVVLIMPRVGQVTLFRSNERALTAGGLFVKDFSDELLSDLPRFMFELFKKHPLVIQLPKNTRLNRERNDFEDSDHFTKYLKRHLAMFYYAAYIQLFIKGEAKIKDLPGDFFAQFRTQGRALLARNPKVHEDAALLNSGVPLSDYLLYQDRQLLCDLMCLLKLIPYTATGKPEDTKMMSIYDFGVMVDSNVKILEDQLPPDLQAQIKYTENAVMAAQSSNSFMSGIQQSFQSQPLATQERIKKIIEQGIDWRHAGDFDQANNKYIKLFFMICQAIMDCMPNFSVDFQWSTKEPRALAFVISGGHTIFFNPAQVFYERDIKDFFKFDIDHKLKLKYPRIFAYVLKELIETISHECVHLTEGPCDGTHNTRFYEKQRALIAHIALHLDDDKIYQSYVEFFNQYLKIPQMDMREYMAMVFKSFEARLVDMENGFRLFNSAVSVGANGIRPSAIQSSSATISPGRIPFAPTELR